MSGKMKPIDPAERMNIQKLQSELKDSNKEKKVEWLYTGDKLDKEAYLLGKPIDKILIEKEIEKPKELFASTVDLANKIREDPLFEIKKKEIEAKKRLLENPVRVKQLKEMITREKGSKQNKSDSDSDSDNYRNRRDRRDDIRSDRHRYRDERRYERGGYYDEDRNRREHERRPYYRNRDRSSSSERVYTKKSKNKRESSSRSRSRSRSRARKSLSQSPPPTAKSNYGLQNSNQRERESNNESSTKSKSKSQLEIEEYKQRIQKLKQIRTNEKSSEYDPKQTKSARTGLSQEEKEKKLKEMQENAKWRNDVRDTNIKKYKHDSKKEDELQETSKNLNSQTQASHLFNNIMKDAYSSAEDRIKRNIKNIQRNQSEFDRNFARK